MRHAEVHPALAAGKQMLKGVLTLELDEVVRVLFDVLSVDEPLGELEHLDLKVGVIEKRQRLLRRDLARVIVVVAEHDLLRVATE